MVYCSRIIVSPSISFFCYEYVYAYYDVDKEELLCCFNTRQRGRPEKNRIPSDSIAEDYQNTMDTMPLDAPIDKELVETISSAVKQSVTANMETILKGMIYSIVDGDVSSLRTRITLVEANEIHRKENKLKRSCL
ncbi:hypothetical protein DPMN_115473 [Dreissena polymorpha]|uniref:Uncharacterized protein n=1 Tax=Dreissena polymorpha TaxID=45954 RepID=A0A9D4KL89_DREPO|nr:hypothetical protein DPMN_115473 [Dreissena polymorpha]